MNQHLTDAEVLQLEAEQDDRPLFVIAYTIAALGGAIIGFGFGLGIGAGWL